VRFIAKPFSPSALLAEILALLPAEPQKTLQ
jgi:DNA-binding response OmpR family regulator